MPIQVWVGEWDDLDFIQGRRPRNLRELLERGDPWTTLFQRWGDAHLTAEGDGSLMASDGPWPRLLSAYRMTGSMRRTLGTARVREGEVKLLNVLVAQKFFNACGELRGWLEHEKEQARLHIEAELGSVPWYRSGERAKLVKQKQLARVNKAVSTANGKEQLDGKDLAYVEGVLAGFTRSVKPRLAELYGHYAPPSAGTGPSAAPAGPRPSADLDGARQALAEAHSLLLSAEAKLRDACQYKRNPSDGILIVPPRKVFDVKGFDRAPEYAKGKSRNADAALISAWVEYTEACAALARAVHDACADFVSWAAADTSAKVQENFATVNPKVAAAQLVIRFSVFVLAATIDCLAVTTAPVTPQVAAAVMAGTTICQTLLDALQKLATSGISRAVGSDPDVMREHVGRVYHPAPNGLAGAAGEASWSINTFYQPIAPALKWAAETGASSSGLVAATPVVGHLWRLGGMTVQLEQLLNARVLEDAGHRDALLRTLEAALGGLSETSSVVEVTVHAFDPDGATADVTVNGERGTLWQGRFQPEDRSGIYEESLDRWAMPANQGMSEDDIEARRMQKCDRGGIDGHMSLRAGDHQGYFREREDARFTLLNEDEPATPQTVAQAIKTHAEDDSAGGFVCTASASLLGLPPGVGADRWDLEFVLGYDGGAYVTKATFRCLTLNAEDDPNISAAAADQAAAWTLYCSWAEVRRLLPLVPWLLDAVTESFGFTGEGLVADGGHVVSLDDIFVLAQYLDEVKALRADLESEPPSGTRHFEGVPDLLSQYALGGWQVPLWGYAKVRSDVEGRRENLQEVLQYVGDGRGRERFEALLRADQDLAPLLESAR